MDYPCRIELFGQLKVIRVDGELTRFRTQKIGWILAYLALHREQTVPRERLLDLFWPEMDVESGRGNLNNALSSLRRHLDSSGSPANGVLLADRQSIRLDPRTVRTDVQEFEESLRAAARPGPGSQRVALLESAAALYRGGLLPGCYEEWAIQEQQRLHGLYTDALGHGGEALERTGELPDALAVTQRAVQADFYREEFHRRQMRLQAMLGRPAAALESYRQMEQRFRADLGAAPSVATQELARRLREDPTAFTRPLREPPPPAPESVAPSAVAPPPTPPQSLPATAGNAPPGVSVSPLPLVLTRYFGRGEEQTRLIEMLSGTDARLVTLIGPGGAGKTRLAVEVARQTSPVFAGRVWWVSLADLPDARLLSSAITRALKVSETGVGDPMEAVLARLNEAPCVLILDNFEHLLRDEPSGGAKGDQGLLDIATALVRLLLERAPNLRCLITSRRALRLNGEQEYPLAPLPVPTDSSLPEEVLASASVALYADRARLALPDFRVTPNNAGAVARICRKLEGMPLTIEMAAAWAKVFPPAKMLERLEERLDSLTTVSGRRRDLPVRHQSLRATIDWSYDLLDAPQKRLLTRLSVFRGGWTLEAAEQVCASDDGNEDVLELLISLADKSLVVCEEGESGGGRYRLLETIRQYGRDRLEESGEATPVRTRHFVYYRTMAEESWKTLRGHGQVACLNRLEREHDNLRAALIWSRTDEGRQQAGREAELELAGRLRPFWDMRNHWREGRRHLEAALESVGVAKTKPTEVLALALLGAGLLANNMADRAVARLFCEESLRICQQLGDTQGLASVTTALGAIAREEGDFAAAHRWYEQSMDAVRSTNDTYTLTTLLGHLGILAAKEKNPVAELRYMEESLALSRQSGDTLGVAILQHNLSSQFMVRKDFPASYAAMEESLTILREVGDRRFTALALEGFAFGEFLQGRIANGVRFIAAGRRIRDEIGAPPNPAMESNLIEARGDLGDEAFASALAAGRALKQEQAIEEALESIAIIRREKV